jgi:hypothetical protein
MENANLASCASPECGKEFKRLGEGKLFVRPAGSNDTGQTQKALWLCPECAGHFDLRFDRGQQEYSLIRHRHVA